MTSRESWSQTSPASALQLDAQGIDLEWPLPERIFPTQVYQRADLLDRQLEVIEQLL